MRNNTIPVHNINDMLPCEVDEINEVLNQVADRSFEDHAEHVTHFFDDVICAGGEVVGIEFDGMYHIGDEDFLILSVMQNRNAVLHINHNDGSCRVKIRDGYICQWSRNLPWLRELCVKYMDFSQ